MACSTSGLSQKQLPVQLSQARPLKPAVSLGEWGVRDGTPDRVQVSATALVGRVRPRC